MTLNTMLSFGISPLELSYQQRGGARVNFKDSRPKLSAMHRQCAGEAAVVVANGPSLDVTSLEKLSGFTTFAANKIYKAYTDTNWRPDFYLVNDKLVAQQNRDQILGLKSQKIFAHSVFDELKEDANALFIESGSSSAWRASAPPAEMINAFKELWVPPDWNPVSGMRAGNSVTNFALKIAFWMGFDTVYVIGLDHHFSLDETVSGEKAYGNSVMISDGSNQNHFSSSYRESGEKWTFPQLELMADDFDRAREVYESVGRNIVNATPNSAYQGWTFGSIPKETQVYSFGKETKKNSSRPNNTIAAIITAYNAEKTLSRAIESVLAQSSPVDEIIIVNDGSTDLTGEILEQYSDLHENFIRVIQHPENRGQGEAFLSAFAEAHGDFFSLLDADDTWDANKILKLKSQIEADNQCLLFQQNLRIVDDTGKESSREHFREVLVAGNMVDFMRSYNTLMHFVPSSGLTISRGLVCEMLPEISDFRISADGLITRVASRLGPFSTSLTPSGSYFVTGENSTYNNKQYSETDHSERLKAALKTNYLRAGRASWLPPYLGKSTPVSLSQKPANKLGTRYNLASTKKILRKLLSPLATRLWSWLNS